MRWKFHLVPRGWDVVRVRRPMNPIKKLLHVFIETAFANLVRKGFDKCVMTTVATHTQLQRTELATESA
jgi:hypothetical protein